MIRAHNVQAYMRAQGMPWDQINQEMAAAQQQRLQENGNDFWGMAAEMGFGDPQIMRDRLKIEQRMASAWDTIKGVAEGVGHSIAEAARTNLSYYNRALSGELRNEPLGNLRTLGVLGVGAPEGTSVAAQGAKAIYDMIGGKAVMRGAISDIDKEPEYKTKEGKPYNPNTDA
jgi:hypothetical protein